MEKVKYGDTFIYVDNSPLNDNETGKLKADDLDDTLEIKTFSNEQLLANTITDVWGNKDE